MDDDDRELIARYKPWRAILLFILSLGFVAAGIWLLGLDPSEEGSRQARRFAWAFPWLPWVTIVFFGLCALGWGRTIVDKRPQLVVSPEGLYWRKQSEAVIPWSEIMDIDLFSISGTKIISLKLKDPSAYPATGLAAVSGRLNVMSGYGDISIAATGLDCSFDEIVAAIEHFSNAGGQTPPDPNHRAE